MSELMVPPYMHSVLSGVVALQLLWQHVLKHASLPDHHLLSPTLACRSM